MLEPWCLPLIMEPWELWNRVVLDTFLSPLYSIHTRVLIHIFSEYTSHGSHGSSFLGVKGFCSSDTNSGPVPCVRVSKGSARNCARLQSTRRTSLRRHRS